MRVTFNIWDWELKETLAKLLKERTGVDVKSESLTVWAKDSNGYRTRRVNHFEVTTEHHKSLTP